VRELLPGSKTRFSRWGDDGGAAGVDPLVMTIEATAAAITVEGLTKRYGELVAVDDLSFSVRPGSVTGFLGPNGAGKTTALKAIVGIARPTAGRALIHGSPVESAHADARVLGVYIEPTGAHPGRSARNHLRSLAALAGLPRGRVDDVLGIVGLEDAVDRRVGTFSTGMRQRLGLASALLGDPEVLVLDEPLNGLDPQGIRWLRTFLRDRAAAGGTVLLSSHVLTEAAQTVDDVVVIHKGRLVHQGAIDGLTGLAVAVRTPMPERLVAAACHAGGRVQLEPGGGRLLIEGMDAAQVGELAHGERVILHELVSQGASLERVFFNLTEEGA
jgi:ABC-2 type transport system ATP-binding protein